jgi:sugar-specific transcriptional regulator TrmB
VLDSLVEKGFARVIQDRTKLFSAVPPEQALSAYLSRRTHALEAELAEQSKAASALLSDLASAYAQGQEGRGTLDFLRLVNDPGQTAGQFRSMLAAARVEYLEFSRPPYAVDPLDVEEILQARLRGVQCRLIVERGTLDAAHQRFLAEYENAGVQIRQIDKVPMKMTVMDGRCGLLALVDPVTTKPAWTAVVFEHEGMAEAMKSLFEDYWRRASAGTGKP